MSTPFPRSLRYHGNRLNCDDGYDEPDLRVASMRFLLTQTRAVSETQTRLVRVGDRSFRIWSPNSPRAPYYPGPIRSGFFPTTPVDRSFRRYDGHVGRHDNLYVPQYRRLEAAHWPFMRRATSVAAHDDLAPAYADLSQHWEDIPGGRNRGRLSNVYLKSLSALNARLDDAMLATRDQWKPTVEIWDARPSVACLSTVQALEQVGSWDEAVDLGVAVQRSVREKDAWCQYVATWGRFVHTPMEELLFVRHPPANDQLVGVWLNGMEEVPAVRYLAAGVPCFVIHEYRPGTVHTNWGNTAPERRDFFQDTEAARLVGDRNPYQKLAQRLGFAGIKRRDIEGSFLGPLPAEGYPDYSSLSYVRDYTRTIRIRASSPARIPIMQSQGLAPTEMSSAGPSTSENQSASAAVARPATPTLERRVLDARRHPWVVPPPIAIAPQGQKWSDWVLKRWEESTAWVFMGRRQDIATKSTWFDRSRCRRLHFGHFSTIPGVLEWQTFGAPVPQFPFMHPDGRGGAKPKSKSIWMYPTERPEKGTTGRTMGQPDAQRLPLLPQQESSDPTDTDVPMEVEPAGTPAEEESVDDDLGGMDLDDSDAEDSSTRIVVIDGLSTESSTSSFHEVTRSLFFRAGVSPLKVVWHAGRMWVLMKDVREGQRAMGALAELAGDRRISFGWEGEYSRAVGLSNDIWIGSNSEGDRAAPAPTSSSEAIATPPLVESLDAPRTATLAETIPADSVPVSAGSALEAVGLHTSAIADSPMEDSLEAPRAPLEPLEKSPVAPRVDEPSRPPAVNEPAMNSDVARQLGDEGIFRLFAPSLRALTRKPSSPLRLPPSAPRAMRTAVPAKVPPLPTPVAPPSLATRMADPAPFWTRISPQEKPHPSRMPPPRPELLDRLSSEAPVPLLSRFSSPPPVAGPSLLRRMGDSTTWTAPSTSKRPRSPSPVELPASPQAPAPRKARRGMRGGETARQQRARRAERERLLALELSAMPAASTSSATPVASTSSTSLSARLQLSVASTLSAPRTSLSARLQPSVASTSSAPRTSLSARLQPSVRAAPSTGPLSEMDQALREADWTLTQAEAAAPLDRMDLDAEDEELAWNDPSM
ncbi:hypothetical protein GGX14DRAFT_575688 [Mycena pura]|uniref:Uncharacterized protein n=1 Tax=Mycena pura TaxID=153505 RepID=A0AAD6UYM6_9AGAR|nr:hypothetical protein GGX14DRAFT_575688 [Mycena pura]